MMKGGIDSSEDEGLYRLVLEGRIESVICWQNVI